MYEQTYARVGVDIGGVLGESADEDDRACSVVEHEWNERAERIAVKLFRNRREHAAPPAAQIAPCLGAFVHFARRRAMSARRLPSAMQSFFSSSVIARSLVAPATWLAPYGVPPLTVEISSGSV